MKLKRWKTFDDQKVVVLGGTEFSEKLMSCDQVYNASNIQRTCIKFTATYPGARQPGSLPRDLGRLRIKVLGAPVGPLRGREPLGAMNISVPKICLKPPSTSHQSQLQYRSPSTQVFMTPPTSIPRTIRSSTKLPNASVSTATSAASTITIDLLIDVLNQTLFNPFLAALLPLCLRALAASYTSPSFLIVSLFAICVNVYHLISFISQRIAYGTPRKVDWKNELVVITGGKGGLGGVLAEILGMKGVDVAVLDVNVTKAEEEEGISPEAADLMGNGIRYWRCDVGNVQSVEGTWKKVVESVGPFSDPSCRSIQFISFPVPISQSYSLQNWVASCLMCLLLSSSKVFLRS